jgi:hypothetical protein
MISPQCVLMCLQTLDGLPNCVFDASGPMLQYSMQARAGGFFAKLAELSAVGALTGSATSILASAGEEFFCLHACRVFVQAWVDWQGW